VLSRKGEKDFFLTDRQFMAAPSSRARPIHSNETIVTSRSRDSAQHVSSLTRMLT